MFKPRTPVRLKPTKAAPTIPSSVPGAGPLPKPRSNRHTTPRPRFHRAKMGGLGKSAYGAPNRAQAFSDPMDQPGIAFPSTAEAAGGGSIGAPEPNQPDGGPEGPPE